MDCLGLEQRKHGEKILFQKGKDRGFKHHVFVASDVVLQLFRDFGLKGKHKLGIIHVTGVPSLFARPDETTEAVARDDPSDSVSTLDCLLWGAGRCVWSTLRG